MHNNSSLLFKKKITIIELQCVRVIDLRKTMHNVVMVINYIISFN